MKGLVNCNFLPGSAPDGLSLAQFHPSPCRARTGRKNSGRSAKRLACRARVLLAKVPIALKRAVGLSGPSSSRQSAPILQQWSEQVCRSFEAGQAMSHSDANCAKPRTGFRSRPAPSTVARACAEHTRPATAPAEDDDLDEIKSAVLAKLALYLGKDASVATDRDWFVAAALTIRDRIVHRWLAVDRASHAHGRKRVYYLSLEFLIGRLFADVLCNLGWTETFRAALGDLGVDLHRLRAAEPDAALGHGGLGRNAACFMESMATLGIPAYGYGIRYDHGLFRQVIRDGWQQEYPEEWLSFGNPWEFARPEVIYDIHFGGWVETTISPTGVKRSVWHPAETLEAARPTRKSVAPVVCTSRRSSAPRCVQHGRS